MRTPRASRLRALRPRLLLPALALAAAFALACVGHTVPVEGAAPAEVEITSGQSLTEVVATLVVENSRMIDYRIYLTRQGGERLGLVSGPGRATFLLKGAQLPHTGELRVVAVPVAAREVLASAAYIPRGSTARFRITPNEAYLIVDPRPAPPDSATTDSTSHPDSTGRRPR
jgi:hypothetical protein